MNSKPADVEEIPTALNRANGRIRQFTRDNLAILASFISVIICISLLTATIEILVEYKVETTTRNNVVEYQVEELRRSNAVYRIRAAKLDAWLKANGVPIEEIYGEDNEP